MLLLILLLVVGAALAYVSNYNLMPVTVNLGLYTFLNVPLFYVIVGSVVVGLLLSYIAYLIHAISASLALQAKARELKTSKEEVLELTKRVHQLELENEKLQHGDGGKPQDPNAL
jgi:uncharacterized integral membrane protein